MTALLLAVVKSHAQMLALLISMGADLERRAPDVAVRI